MKMFVASNVPHSIELLLYLGAYRAVLNQNFGSLYEGAPTPNAASRLFC